MVSFFNADVRRALLRCVIDAGAISFLHWIAIDLRVPLPYDLFETIFDFYIKPAGGSQVAKLPRAHYLQQLFDLGVHWQAFSGEMLHRIANTFVKMAMYDKHWEPLDWLFFHIHDRDRTELRTIIYSILMNIIQTSIIVPKEKAWSIERQYHGMIRDPDITIPYATEWLFTAMGTTSIEPIYGVRVRKAIEPAPTK